MRVYEGTALAKFVGDYQSFAQCCGASYYHHMCDKYNIANRPLPAKDNAADYADTYTESFVIQDKKVKHRQIFWREE
jgi:hypothetical protein